MLFKNIIDGGQQHSGNSKHSFLMTSALFQSIIKVDNFQMLIFTFNHGQSALNQKRFGVNAGAQTHPRFSQTDLRGSDR
jgi:hypothetical protein